MEPTAATTEPDALQTAAAVTMVKGDLFFLKMWIDYYGLRLGKQNLYVINHGRGDDVRQMADGCNVIGIPEGSVEGFDRIRWRFLNAMVSGLVAYYTHVIVGDVDEFLVLDPAAGVGLREWLQNQPSGGVITALGLEVLHHPDEEPVDLSNGVLGPRRFVRASMHYSKPSIVSGNARIARGGHFASHPKLNLPDHLYLFHLKYCDFGAYVNTVAARNSYADQSSISFRQTAIGRHWFSQFRGDDAKVFQQFAALPLADGFNMDGYRNRMRETFAPRGETGFFQFDRTEDELKHVLPDRFFGAL